MKRKVLLLMMLLPCGLMLKAQSVDFLSIYNKHSDLKLVEIDRMVESAFDSVGRGKGTGYKQYRRWLYQNGQNREQDGTVKRANVYAKKSAAERAMQASQNFNMSWEELGPFSDITGGDQEANIGRLMSVAIASNKNTLWVASDGGGLWRSNNNGASWIDYGAKLPTLNLAYAALAPSNDNVVYVIDYDNYTSLYKSENGGASFTKVNVTEMWQGNKIVVHPTNPNILFVTGSDCVYRSTDGGRTFTQLLYAMEASFADLAFHPTNSNIVYTANKSNFYKSTDGGVNFTSYPLTLSNVNTRIAVSPQYPNRAWVVSTSSAWPQKSVLYYFNGDDNSLVGVTQATECIGNMPYRNMALAIHPQDSAVKYIAGVKFYRYAKTIKSWRNVYKLHADIQEVKFVDTRMYVVTDGGISYFDDTNTAVSSMYNVVSINNNLPIKQVYKIDVSRGAEECIVYGSQDNGGAVYRDGLWSQISGGDGGYCVVNPDNIDEFFTTVCVAKGIVNAQRTAIVAFDATEESTAEFLFPLDVPRSNPQSLYYGTTNICRTSFDGATKETLFDPALNQYQYWYRGWDVIKVAPSDENVIYAVNNVTNAYTYEDEVHLYKSSDKGATWNRITSLPASVTDIEDLDVHPTNPNYVVVIDSWNRKLYESVNGGNSWSEISRTGGFGTLPLYAVCYEGDGGRGIYVASLGQLFYTNEHLSDVLVCTGNLPNVKINDVKVNPVLGKVYIGTYGRGVWRADTYAKQTTQTEKVTYSQARVFASGGALYVENSAAEQLVLLEMYDGLGRKVYSVQNPDAKVVPNVPAGVYVVKLTNSNNESSTRKLILR